MGQESGARIQEPGERWTSPYEQRPHRLGGITFLRRLPVEADVERTALPKDTFLPRSVKVRFASWLLDSGS